MAIQNHPEHISEGPDSAVVDVRRKLNALKKKVSDQNQGKVARRGDLIHHDDPHRFNLESDKSIKQLEQEKEGLDQAIQIVDKAEFDSARRSAYVVAKVNKEEERKGQLEQLDQSLKAQAQLGSDTLQKIQQSKEFIQKPTEEDVIVEVATEFDFEKIDADILELASEIFPNNNFEISKLGLPETQFKLAMLDGIVRQFKRAQMPGNRSFRDLSLSDQRQLVWNIQKILLLLNPALRAGKILTRKDLDKTLAQVLAIEKQVAMNNKTEPYRPIKLANADGVIFDTDLWQIFEDVCERNRHFGNPWTPLNLCR